MAELSIMPAIQFARGLDLSTVAKRLRLRPDQVGRKIRRLSERGLIFPGVLVNHFALGLRDWCVLFSPLTERERSTKQIVAWLTSHHAVWWFAEFSGEYRFAVNILVRSSEELCSFFEELFQRFGPIISNRIVAERTSFQLFPYRCFGERRIFEAPKLAHLHEASIDFDETDALLLEKLSSRPESSTRDLMQATGLAQTTVSYRLRKMQSSGILPHLTWVLDPLEAGITPHRLFLASRAPSADQRKAIENFCQSEPGIYFLAFFVGAWDYEIALVVQSGKELKELLERFWEQFSETIAKVHILEGLASHRARFFPGAHLAPSVRGIASKR